MNEKEFKTSQYINDDDLKDLQTLRRVKRQMSKAFKPDFLIELLVEIIDKSDIVSFTSNRAKKFIDKKAPVFNLSVDKEKAMEKYEIGKIYREDDEINYLSNVVYNEVISKFSNDMYEKAKEFNEDVEESTILFKNDNDKEIFEALLITNIFGSKIDIERNQVSLEYLR